MSVRLRHSLRVKHLLAIVLGSTGGMFAGVPHMCLGYRGVLCSRGEITLVMVADGFAVKCQRLFQVIDGVEVELTCRLCVNGLSILRGSLLVVHGMF